MYVSIGKAAALVGVSISTMRRWEEEGFLIPAFRTLGGHRRYLVSSLENALGLPKESNPRTRKALAYARVSSSDQRSDLETQKEKLVRYCSGHFTSFEVISDLGSGLNFNKPGLKKLLNTILEQKISHLILNHKDRLLRFGSDLIFALCRHFQVEVIILEKSLTSSCEEELTCDVIELMTVFSARLYGRRSHRDMKALAA